MSKLPALLIPLIAAATPALAQTAKPPVSPPVSITNDAKKPDDLGCMMRMMDLVLMTSRVAKDEKRSDEDRKSAQAMYYEADTAFFYYAGLLGRDYFKTNRSAEGQAEFARLRANPREQLTREMALCLAQVQDARKQVTGSLARPKP